jgi:tRNA pseudouridine38-40 synthase
MARYQIVLAYDGTGFSGSQRQGKRRTVQGEFENALRKISWTGQTILFAGRTDTGVHASGQVAAFDLEWAHGLDDLKKALNANFPLDMAVRSVNVASMDFHPRFDASSRCYRYSMFCSVTRDPLRERYSWRVWPPVEDLEPLAKIWLGTHDFAAFGSPPRTGGSTKRSDDEWSFEVQADAFLYRMVRRLVFAQVAAGQGRVSVDDLSQALANRTRILAGLAPPNGLTLFEVRYDNRV